MHAQHKAEQHNQDWPVWGGQSDNDHYSTLTQINPRNVSRLKVAWTFDSHEAGGLQTSPLIVGRVLYGYTPTQKVIALDAATGKVLWTFDSGVKGSQPTRGLAWYASPNGNRIFAGIMEFLYALDPATGHPIDSFGEHGRIDLRKNLRGDYKQQSIVMTSPGVIYKDLIIVGGRNPETHPSPPGDIRAFDVHTGAMRWSFHTIPHPGEPGHETWPAEAWKTSGAANNWAGMVVDQQRGILYAPTGSSVFDFYGSDRIGNDLYANTLLALDASTGKRLWHFQGVHHDIWDRDFPSAPTLVTIHRDGQSIDAVAQTTKQAYVYLFDRATGAPLFPIEEKPYPPSDVPGEKASPTQPLPTKPEPFGRQFLTADMLTNRTPAAHAYALEKFNSMRSAGQFVPFSVDKDTIVFPGFDGGAEWGGSALDPKRAILYVNENEMAWMAGLTRAHTGGSSGEQTYANLCSVCHGPHREGAPPAFPSLIGVSARLSEKDIMAAIYAGKGRMPGFPSISDNTMHSLLAFLNLTAAEATTPQPPSDKKELSSATTPRTAAPDNSPGAQSYLTRCAICHGDQLEGIPPSFPALLGIGTRTTKSQALDIIRQGKGRMPGFTDLKDVELTSLLIYLGITDAPPTPVPDTVNLPYQFTGYRKFLDQDGYPAISPPWGTLNAIDLNTGKYLWKIPLGEYPDLAAKGMTNTGSENYGGPIVTASGLLFIGATSFDRRFRAFDAQSGKLLWQTTLDYSATATPATYSIDGKQYVVIAAGGGRDPKVPSGGQWVAFALP